MHTGNISLKHYCFLIRNNGSIKIENLITDMFLEFQEVAEVNVPVHYAILTQKSPNKVFKWRKRVLF